MKIQKFVDLVSNKNNIYFNIEKVDSEDKEKLIINKMLYGECLFSQDELFEQPSVRLYIEDNQRNNEECVTMLNVRQNKTISGFRWK